MSTPAGRLATPQFLVLWVASFAFCFSFYLLLPTLPLYAQKLGIAESSIGLIMGVFALSSMVVKPWAGWAADRYGRRPLLLAGSLIFLGSALLYGWSRTAVTLLLLRIFHGTGMGLYPTSATALVGDVAPPARRGEAMGYFGAASNLALALAPAVGVWVAERLGFPMLFATSAVAGAVAVGLTAVVRETVPTRFRVPFSLSAVLSQPALFPSAILFCLMATYGVHVAFLPLYVHGLEGGNPGIFFLAFALVVATVRGYTGRLSDRIGRAPVTAAGMLLTGLAMAGLAFSGRLTALVLAGGLYGIGFGAANPSLMAWAVDRVSPEERGKAMGTFYTAWELGIGAGAIGFGFLLGASSFTAMFMVAAGIALLGGAGAVAQLRR